MTLTEKFEKNLEMFLNMVNWQIQVVRNRDVQISFLKPWLNFLNIYSAIESVSGTSIILNNKAKQFLFLLIYKND